MIAFAAALLAVASAVPAAALDCDKAPKEALSILKERAMRVGGEVAFHGAPVEVLPGGAEGKQLMFESDEHQSFTFAVVLQVPPVKLSPNSNNLTSGAIHEKPKPRSLFFVHLYDEAGYRHRWMFRSSLTGKLLGASSFRDRLDEHGEITGGTEIYRRGPGDPMALSQFGKELRAACMIAKENVESLQDKIAEADAAKKGAAGAKKAGRR